MQDLEETKNEALDLMRASGFIISEQVLVAVDEKLPIMGYTTSKHGKPLIVVSQWALDSDMLIGLLIHELSHVYRTEKKHPSHNFKLHNSVLKNALEGRIVQHYQEEILHNIINSIQDLYADDIFFKIFKKKHIPVNIADFFLNWINKPLKDPSIKSTWINAGYVISAAFAQANLEKHGIRDRDEKIENAIKEFLSQIDSRMARKFKFFKTLMMNLPEPVTDKEFEKILSEYVEEFLYLAQLNEN